MMAKPEKTQTVTLFRVTLAVTAELLPQLHKAIGCLAATTSIEHWYDNETEADAAAPPADGAANEPAAKRPSLVDEVLRLAAMPGGVTRTFLKEATVGYSPPFNVGSISPTLVTLMKDKRIKRIGRGVYGIPEVRRNLVKK
jgi:hypothetical protein